MGNTASTVAILASDGSVHDIPQENQQEALRQGFKLAVPMRDKDGKSYWLPHDRVKAAQAQGFQRDFEADNPKVEKEGFVSAAREGIRGIGSGILSMFDPTRGPSGAGLSALGINPRAGTVRERLGEAPIAGAYEEAKAAIEDPTASLSEKIFSGPAALLGMSASKARERANRGDSGAILGQAAVPVGLAVAGPIAGENIPKIAPKIRPALQRAAYKEFPTIGAPQLTRGARSTSSLLGAGAGATLGGTLGGAPGGYIGGHAGLILGPSLMESILGTPELGDIRNPGPFGKVPIRTPRPTPQPTIQPSPFEGMTSSATPLGNTKLPVQMEGIADPQRIELVKEFSKPEKSASKIIDPTSKPPHVEGSYWSFTERALRKTVMSGDRDAAIVYKQRFGELPLGARYLTDVAEGPTRGLYRSK